MSIAQLVAVERNENPKKVRQSGYLPGVIYGKEVKDNHIVKFKYSDVAGIISQHGESARLNVVLNNKKHLGLIKDVQKNHISNKIIHLDIQFTSKNDEMKVKIPIIYEGITDLEFKRLIFEINKQEIEVLGKLEDIPEMVKIDVSGMTAGAHITCIDLNLGKNVKPCSGSETLASVFKMKEAEEEEEEKTEEPSEA